MIPPMQIWARPLALASLFLALAASAAFAHDSRPISLRIAERAEGMFTVTWQVPATVSAHNLPTPKLPQDCTPMGSAKSSYQSGAYIGQQVYNCGQDLAGRSVEIVFPDYNPSLSAIMQIEWLSGKTEGAVFEPNDLRWDLPDRTTRAGVSKRYFSLGMEHIFGGYDHLLFLFCLLLIARTPRRTIITVTGFTLAHSLTLALAVFEVVSLPVAAVESVIALSIVFLAAEISRGRATTLSYSYPVLVASIFGLLHGLGFASALSEVGLPQGQIPLALLLFNLGIEAGQLLVLTPIFAVIVWLNLSNDRVTAILQPLRHAGRLTIYAVGSLAAYWFLERVTQAFAV